MKPGYNTGQDGTLPANSSNSTATNQKYRTAILETNTLKRRSYYFAFLFELNYFCFNNLAASGAK